MEILVDIVSELHSIIWTTFTDQCYFVKLKHNKDLGVVFNNITYFTANILFILWFVKVFISRVQEASGNNLKSKDKCLVAVVSMVFAMHVLWPFLLFLIHFLICVFYPWSTAVIVLLLNIIFIIAVLKMVHLNISTKIPHCKNYIKSMYSFCSSTEPTFARISLGEVRIVLSEGDNVSPRAVTVMQPILSIQEECGRSVIQPRLSIQEECGQSVIQSRLSVQEECGSYVKQPRLSRREECGPSETPAMQPIITPSKQSGSSPVTPKRSQKVFKESRGQLDTSRIQSQLILENLHEPFEIPVIQARVDLPALHKAFQAPQMQSYLGHIGSYKELETLTIQHQVASRESNSASEALKMQSQSLLFESNRQEIIRQVGISEDSTVGASEGSSGPFMGSESPLTPLRATGQINDKDFSQQVDLNRTEVKTIAPRRNPVKRSKEDGGKDHGSQSGYCERCGKKTKQSFRPEVAYTTRSGTVFGPTNIFCQCINL